MNAPCQPAVRPRPTAYQPFIDGLRALSVLSVVAYHVGIPGASGGYVGVDIFFVISGYLIISQILENLGRGTFSLGEFWARRALRILPPYFLIIALAIVLAPFLLTMPDEFKALKKEVGLAALMVVNHLYLIQQGYFDTVSDTKVLLHLWSLAVEEQFYIIAPLLLAVAWWLPGRFQRPDLRTSVFGLIAIVLFFVTFAGCIIFTSADGGRNYGFYLAPLRAWEFIAGGVIGFVAAAGKSWTKRTCNWIAAAGMAAVLFPVFVYDKNTLYPTWRAAVPVFGAAALISAGLSNPQAPVIRLLATRPMVWIGLISYAWYLWHWPLLAFARIADFGERSLLRDIAIGFVSFGMAVATFYLVEKPVRRWRQAFGSAHGWRPVFLSVACCVTVALGAVFIFNAYQKPLEAATGTVRTASSPPAASFCDLGYSDMSVCDAMALGRPTGLLIGDSHALSGRDRLAAFAQERGGLLLSIARPGCMTFLGMRVMIFDRQISTVCESMHLNAVPKIIAGDIRPSYAIIYARWSLYGSPKRAYQFLSPGSDVPASDQDSAFVEGLTATLASLRSQGVARILIIGPTPIFTRSPPNCLFLADKNDMDRVKTCGIARTKADSERQIALRRLKSTLSTAPDVRFLDPFDAFCDNENCIPYSCSDTLLSDTNHLSYQGMDRIITLHRADFDWVADTAGH